MAEVFEGLSTGAEGFTRRVAIKRILPGYSKNPTFAKMFVEEAQLSSRLAHPNIVSVLDFDRDRDGQLFLVTELVSGTALNALTSTGLFPYPVIVHIIAEVLRGLGYAHDMPVGGNKIGVIHRDVSPHNVLLSWDGDVKLSDFGIAKARSTTEASSTELLMGKPAYMSPEQANGQPLDGRSDLFAVGIMLWEMLTGRRLFAAEDTRATLAAVLFGKIPRPRRLVHAVPKDLEQVAMKLLERDLHARYRNADGALAELLECRDAGPGGRDSLREVLQARLVHGAAARETPSTRTRINAPTRLKRVALLIFLAVAVVVGVGIGMTRHTVHDERSVASVARDTPMTEAKASLAAMSPPCTKLFRELETLSRCVSQSAMAQWAWSVMLKDWQRGAVGNTDVQVVETDCKQALAALTFPDCLIADSPDADLVAPADAHLDDAPTDAPWETLDKKGVPPVCVTYMKIFQRISTCVLIAPSPRAQLLREVARKRQMFECYTEVSDLNDFCQQLINALLPNYPGC